MRAYLIDADLRKVIEFDLDDSLDGIEQLLDLDRRGGFTIGSGPLNRPNDEPDYDRETFLADYLYVRDTYDQFLTPSPGKHDPPVVLSERRPTIKGDPRLWFQIDAHLEEPATFPLPGRGLVVGVSFDGEWIDARISLKELTARVTFTRRKLRGTTTRSRIMPGETWIGPWAPIVEER